jgi:hypothetical protein
MTTASTHSTMSLVLMVVVVVVVRMATPFPFEDGVHGNSGDLKQAGSFGIPTNKITIHSNICEPTSLENTKLARPQQRER